MGLWYLLAFTDEDKWEPGIGDPTFLGWFTVGMYFVAVLTCAAAAFSRSANRIERMFWSAFCVAMVLLGINKQLDLQTWFTLTGKNFAKEWGWYDERQMVQVLFIAFIALAGAVSLGLLWALVRRAPAAYRIAVAGGVFLLSFIVIRAASFHHVDQFLGIQVGFFRMNHLLEIGGIACVAFAASLAYFSKRK